MLLQNRLLLNRESYPPRTPAPYLPPPSSTHITPPPPPNPRLVFSAEQMMPTIRQLGAAHADLGLPCSAHAKLSEVIFRFFYLVYRSIEAAEKDSFIPQFSGLFTGPVELRGSGRGRVEVRVTPDPTRPEPVRNSIRPVVFQTLSDTIRGSDHDRRRAPEILRSDRP